MLTEWADQLATELGIELNTADGLDIDAILLLARDAAHTVERPAAPVTTFLVGYAAALRGGGAEAVSECTDSARALIQRWDTP